MTYPIEAETPIIEALKERPQWLNVTPAAIATTALSALREAGWGLVYPKDFPGLCPRCHQPVEPGTRHKMFNGNQMFACSVVPEEMFGFGSNRVQQ